MTKFRVSISWTMTGEYEIEAGSPEEANAIALGPDLSLPEGFYLDESIMVDGVEEISEEG